MRRIWLNSSSDVFCRSFIPAFAAWKKTDPLHNPNAPAGPALMPEYRDSNAAEFTRLDHEATELFEQGTNARERQISMCG